MAGKPTFNDLLNAPQSDLKRVYKLDSQQLEIRVRRELDGANSQERRGFYQQVFTDKGKR
jgi:hypothetical protein